MFNLLSDNKWSLIGASALITLALYLRKRSGRAIARRKNRKEEVEVLLSTATGETYEIDREGGATLRFGDAPMGRVPSRGAGNVVASYRVGSGRAGNVGATVLRTTTKGRARESIDNPSPATGGSDPGITLLELFAFLGENLLYRSNEIPEQNREAFLSLLGADVEWDATQSPLAATRGMYRGPDGVRNYYSRWASAWDEWEGTTEEAYRAGDRIVVCIRVRARDRANGAWLEKRLGQLWIFRSGKVIRYSEFPTCTQALETAGLSE